MIAFVVEEHTADLLWQLLVVADVRTQNYPPYDVTCCLQLTVRPRLGLHDFT